MDRSSLPSLPTPSRRDLCRRLRSLSYVAETLAEQVIRTRRQLRRCSTRTGLEKIDAEVDELAAWLAHSAEVVHFWEEDC
jgi:hypothetical protein